MESKTQAKSGNDSNVSCFALDGVVAEMVIDIDVDDSPLKSLKLGELPKLKEGALQQPKLPSENLCADLFSESMTTSDKTVNPAKCSKEEEHSISSEINIDKLKNLESQVEDIIFIDENDPLDSSVELVKTLKEDEVKKSLLSDLNQIREAAGLINEGKDEIPKVASLIKKSKDCDLSESKKLGPALKPADEKKGHDLKRMSKSKASAEKESLKNVLPTAFSTRGIKRKLAEIDSDSVEGNKKKHTNVKNDSKLKGSLEMSTKTLSERMNLKQLSSTTPKKYNLFEKDTKLKNFLHLKQSMNDIDLKFTRQLYRVLFDKWAPNDVDQMKAEILEFSGLPFDKYPEEVLKRKHILKKLPDIAIKKICYMLDLPGGKTDNMISSILKFLNKPTNTVVCTFDPFQSCMQPFVKLENLSFEYKYLLQAEKETSESMNQQIRKVGRPPKKLSELEAKKKHSHNMNQQIRKVGRPPKKLLEYKHLLEAAKKHSRNIGQQFRKVDQLQKENYHVSEIEEGQEIRKAGRPSNKKNVTKFKDLITVSQVRTLKSSPKTFDSSISSTSGTRDEKSSNEISNLNDPKLTVTSGKKSEGNERTFKKSTNSEKRKIPPSSSKAHIKKKSTFLKSSQKKSMKHKIKKLKKEISELKVKVDETFLQAKGNAENGAILPSFGKEKKNEDNRSDSSSFTHRDARNEDYFSEVTLSADENAEETKNAEEPLKKKKKKMMRCGKPLRSFTNIRDSIQNGNFSALQRLHILLFGASDKPENLKANILAFGGFPFLEGSDEWKQKEFLLSLLSLSTLKEYSTLLCIDHIGDDQQIVINKLMKFLAAPGGSSIEMEIETIEDEPVLQMETKVVCSELVQPIKIVDAKSIAPVAPKKKVIKKKEKKKEKGSGYRHRKVLMSEVEVRRLEADIKREQRIREREKRYNDQLALKRSMSLIEPTLTKQKAPTLQKSIIFSQTSSRNMHRTPLGTSVYLPIATAGTGNYQAVTNVPVTLPSAAVNKASKTTPKVPQPAIVKQAHTTPKVPVPAIVKQADAEQLNALLQTVYKRRALKASGATISTPNKGDNSKLGDLPNVKFLVVTANYSDLDVLHHLIYMTDAVKSKVRKNILDFSGFGFNEDSSLYKDRMVFLNTLGYDISKRIAFLLGLCPYKTNIAKQDLNELIMYFLMSPCKTKQVPITHLPQTFFSKSMPEELCMLMQKHSELDISPVLDTSNNENTVEENQVSLLKSSSLESSTLESSALESSPVVASSSTSYNTPQHSGPKAKKSLPSSSTKKKTILSSSASSIPFKDATSLLKPVPPKYIDTNSYALQKAILKTSSLPEPVTSPQEFLVQQLTPDGRQKTYKLIKLPVNHPLSSVIKPQIPNSTPTPPVQTPVLSSIAQTPPVQTPAPSSIIQAPPVPISTSIIPAPFAQTPTSKIQTPPVSLSSSAVTSSWNNSPGMMMPPGIIIFKDQNNSPLAITTASMQNNNLQAVPIVFGQQNSILLPQNISTVPPQANTKLNVQPPANAKVVLPVNAPQEASISSEKDSTMDTTFEVASESSIQGIKTNSRTIRPVSEVAPRSSTPVSKTAVKQISQNEVFGVSKPVQNTPPTNKELFSSIEKIIKNADPEQITLRNVIDKVSEQYSGHNLRSRHLFMKDCVKKIILETS